MEQEPVNMKGGLPIQTPNLFLLQYGTCVQAHCPAEIRLLVTIDHSVSFFHNFFAQLCE